jgi:23S rRNA (adenine1618-N6)-methyltransferase
LLELRLQRSAASIFNGIVKPSERFAAAICNPPFHASAKQAAVGTQRKLRNLGTGGGAAKPILNFGGQHHELWCRGGEADFVRRMIAESVQWSDTVLWFSSLVSKRENLPRIHAAIKAVKPAAVRNIAMTQGQKQSRIVAWTFLPLSQHEAWWLSR